MAQPKDDPCNPDSPPTKGAQEAKFLREARGASIRTNVQQLRAIQRWKEAVGEACGGPQTGYGADPLKSFDWVNELAFEAARHGLDNYNSMLGLSERFGDRIVATMRDALRIRRAPCVAAPGDILSVKGKVGHVSEPAALNVTNRLRCAATVEFLTGDFVEVDDPSKVKQVRPTFEPEPKIAEPAKKYVLEASQSRVYLLRIDLAGFVEGRWAATLVVRANGRATDEIPVRVDVVK